MTKQDRVESETGEDSGALANASRYRIDNFHDDLDNLQQLCKDLKTHETESRVRVHSYRSGVSNSARLCWFFSSPVLLVATSKGNGENELV